MVLLIYIAEAKTQRWAWDGLRGLIEELLMNDEPVPSILHVWGLYQMARRTAVESSNSQAGTKS